MKALKDSDFIMVAHKQPKVLLFDIGGVCVSHSYSDECIINICYAILKSYLDCNFLFILLSLPYQYENAAYTEIGHLALSVHIRL